MGRKRIEIHPIDDSKARSVSTYFNICLICPFQCLVNICQTKERRLQEGVRVRATDQLPGQVGGHHEQGFALRIQEQWIRCKSKDRQKDCGIPR